MIECYEIMTTPSKDRHNYELSVLNEIAQALNRSVDLDAALNASLVYVAQLFGLETGWVWLLNEFEFHVSFIMGKLDAGNRTEAVAIAVQRGLLHR